MSDRSTYVIRRKPHEAPRIGSRLAQLDIELTERCPNACVHCCINRPADDAEARTREMTTDQVRKILDQAADLGCMRVRFTGGEPLLRPDFEELYLYTRRLGMKVLIFTSGRLITPHLVDLLVRIPPLENIEISVYGMSAATYEAVTGTPGSFAQFWRGVNLLLERKVPFIVKGALLPQNRHEMEDFERWASTIPWMSGRPTYAMNFDLRNRRDSASHNARIASLRLSPTETVAILVRDEARYRQSIAEFAARFMGATGDRLFTCGASGGRTLCVDAYGRAQPCMGLRAPELTIPLIAHGVDRDLKTVGSLALALDQFQTLAERRTADPEYLRRCGSCFLKGLCAQCPAKSWQEYGALDTPVDYLCTLAHEQARFLGWLSQFEQAWEVCDWQARIYPLPPIDDFEYHKCA